MSNIIKIASAQLSPVFLDKEKTIEKACNAILEAGEKDAKLIVFPEAFISGYTNTYRAFSWSSNHGPCNSRPICG